MIVAVTTVKRGLAWPRRLRLAARSTNGSLRPRKAQLSTEQSARRSVLLRLRIRTASTTRPVKGSASPMATFPDTPQDHEGVRRIGVAPNDKAARNPLA